MSKEKHKKMEKTEYKHKAKMGKECKYKTKGKK